MKSVSFHMQQQSNSPNSRNGFSIIAQFVSHLPLHPSSHTLVYKHTFSKIIARNFSFFFDRAILRSQSISPRISIPSLYMWRIRQTWTEWESPWHAYGHALLPRFSLPTIIIIDTIGQTFSTRARGDSGRNRKARRRRTVEISYVTLNDS